VNLKTVNLIVAVGIIVVDIVVFMSTRYRLIVANTSSGTRDLDAG